MKLNQHRLYRLLMTILLFYICAICSYGQSRTNPQTGEYATIPIAKTGNKWNILRSFLSGTPGDMYLNRETNTFVLDKTQTINGKEYHRLIVEYQTDKRCIAWVREDAKEGKVYCRPDLNKPTEHLVFDYNIKVGDIFEMCTGNWNAGMSSQPYHVDKITREEIAGMQRRVYWLTEKDGAHWGNKWIEGIGTESGHIFVYDTRLVGSSPHSLICFSDAEGHEWVKNRDLGCIVNDKIPMGIDRPDQHSFTIEQRNGELWVYAPTVKKTTLKLYDMLGRLLIEQIISSETTQIPLEQIGDTRNAILCVGDQCKKINVR